MPSNKHSDRIFNPGERDAIYHGGNARFDIMTRLLWAVEGNPACTEHCEQRLLKIVSCHLKSRGLRHLRSAAGVVRALSELYDSFLISKGQMIHHAVTSGLQGSEASSLPCSALQASNASTVIGI